MNQKETELETNQKLSLEDTINLFKKADKWQFRLICGAYSSYESTVDDLGLFIAHYGTPRGSSKYKNKDRWYNQIRNCLLAKVELFGIRDEIGVTVFSNHDILSKYCLQNEELKDIYRAIHAKEKGNRPILI